MSPIENERYTHGHHESVLKSHSWRTVENSAAYLIPRLAPGLSVLDLGCGPGTITVDLADRVAPGRVVGVDAAADVIAKAAALGESHPNTEFLVGDAYALDFPDDTFDLVHAHQVLQHVGDPVAVLREMRRVAKPGGVVAARDVDYRGTIWYPPLPGLGQWMELYQQVHRSNGGEPNAGRRVKAWAQEAGFTEVEATASIWAFTNAEDRAWWGGMWAQRVLESAFAGDALGKGLADQEELDAISVAWSRWAADDEAALFMPHGEIIAIA